MLSRRRMLIAAAASSHRGYVKDGLSLWLDGINNTRAGHDSDSLVWEDLSGNDYDFVRVNTAGMAFFDENSYVNNGNLNKALHNATAIMQGFEACTVELCLDRVQNTAYQWAFQNRQTNQPPNGFQFVNAETGIFCVGIFRVRKNNENANYSILKNTFTGGNTHTVSFTHQGEIITGFLDGEKTGVADTISIENMRSSVYERTNYTVGSAYGWNNALPFNGHIYSVRIYNRALTENEMAQNFAEDKRLFFQGR